MNWNEIMRPRKTRGGYPAGGTPVSHLPPPPPSVTAAESGEQDRLSRDIRHLRAEVDDLRAFEREYRARLIAFHEGCLRDLQRGDAS